ncbi:MAG: Gfo/Idh/MocA family oxidoreductase [Candidatus Latescibacterota bacterium]
MLSRLRIAVVGVGRIGLFHARHVQEVAAQRGDCELTAVVDGHADLAERAAAQLQPGQQTPIHVFAAVEELLGAGVSEAAIVASRTADHPAHTRALVEAGQRVLLEKPLAGDLTEARALAAWLEEEGARRQAVMVAFQRRFDAALCHARELVLGGRLGRVFKVVSALEDPLPPPDGYQSPGLLADMAVHNLDEVVWLTGLRPSFLLGTGARLHNQLASRVPEDFDDAFLQVWLADDAVAQVVVSRNHVAGYRNETLVCGSEGHVHVGHFEGEPLQVKVEAYGRGGGVLDWRLFELRDYGSEVPVFITRFGSAYRAEVEHFVVQCRARRPFAVGHVEGLRALEVALAGARCLSSRLQAVPVEYAELPGPQGVGG